MEKEIVVKVKAKNKAVLNSISESLLLVIKEMLDDMTKNKNVTVRFSYTVELNNVKQN